MFVRRQNCWDGDKKCWHERNVGMGTKMLEKKCWVETKNVGIRQKFWNETNVGDKNVGMEINV